MPKSLFAAPDSSLDQKLLDQEAQRQKGGIDWSERFWRPKPGKEGNLIRILPARAGSGATYHMTAGLHFVKHAEDGKVERFVCNRETYGTTCVACEAAHRLTMEGQKEAATAYKVRRLGVFNVLDRSDPSTGVRLYEAPRQSVWYPILTLINSRGRMSNLIDVFGKDGTITQQGRDIQIIFNKDALPQNMYQIIATDSTLLGTAEEIEKWFSQIVDLIPTALYPPVDENIAEVKAFGTKEQRDELREMLRKKYEEEKEQAGQGKDAEMSVVGDRLAEEADEERKAIQEEEREAEKRAVEAKAVEEKKKVAETKAAVDKPKPVAKPTSSAPMVDRMAAIRKQIDAARKGVGKK